MGQSVSYRRMKEEEALAAAQKKNPATIPAPPEPKPHSEFVDASSWARAIREEESQ